MASAVARLSSIPLPGFVKTAAPYAGRWAAASLTFGIAFAYLDSNNSGQAARENYIDRLIESTAGYIEKKGVPSNSAKVITMIGIFLTGSAIALGVLSFIARQSGIGAFSISLKEGAIQLLPVAVGSFLFALIVRGEDH